MIRGIGVDIVDVERMGRLLERHGRRAEDRLFTASERSRCRECARTSQCYAARFAAKEATLKALGTGLGEGISWTDVEVESPGDGTPPAVTVSGPARDRLHAVAGTEGTLHLSLSHQGGHAVAVAVLESPPGAR